MFFEFSSAVIFIFYHCHWLFPSPLVFVRFFASLAVFRGLQLFGMFNELIVL